MSIISANNHYAGFGPSTAKLFLETVDKNNEIPSFPISNYQPIAANEMMAMEEDIPPSFAFKKPFKGRQSFISDFFK